MKLHCKKWKKNGVKGCNKNQRERNENESVRRRMAHEQEPASATPVHMQLCPCVDRSSACPRTAPFSWRLMRRRRRRGEKRTEQCAVGRTSALTVLNIPAIARRCAQVIAQACACVPPLCVPSFPLALAAVRRRRRGFSAGRPKTRRKSSRFRRRARTHRTRKRGKVDTHRCAQ
jgi:hypothetical protein